MPMGRNRHIIKSFYKKAATPSRRRKKKKEEGGLNGGKRKEEKLKEITSRERGRPMFLEKSGQSHREF